MKIVKIVACASLASVMMASPSFAAGEPAQVIKGVGCFLSYAVFGLPGGDVTTHSIDVSNNGGNTQLSCHFDVTPGFEPTDRAHNAAGFLCNVIEGPNFVLTTDSKATITPGGKAHLSCQIKKP